MRRVFVLAIAICITFVVAPAAQAAPVPLDNTFSGDGLASIRGSGYEFAFGVVADGSSVVAYGGSLANADRYSRYQLVARFLPSGRPDSDFSGDGIKILRYTKHSSLTDAEVTADGHLVVVGWTDRGVAITKLRPNGALDRSFGNDGVRQLDVAKNTFIPQIEETSDGELVVAWTRTLSWSKKPSVIDIIRLHADGSTIHNFSRPGFDGYDRVDIWRGDALTAMTIAANDRVYLAAWSERRSKPRGVLSVVSMSNQDKLWVSRVDVYGRHGTYPVSIGADELGRAVVGITPTDKSGVGAVRLNPTGSLDQSYSDDGVARADCDCYTSGGVLTDSGVILVGGTGPKTFAARFDPTGEYDSSFSGGEALWNLFDGRDYVRRAAVDDQGRLLISGNYGGSTGSGFVARFLTP